MEHFTSDTVHLWFMLKRCLTIWLTTCWWTCLTTVFIFTNRECSEKKIQNCHDILKKMSEFKGPVGFRIVWHKPELWGCSSIRASPEFWSVRCCRTTLTHRAADGLGGGAGGSGSQGPTPGWRVHFYSWWGLDRSLKHPERQMFPREGRNHHTVFRWWQLV